MRKRTDIIAWAFPFLFVLISFKAIGQGGLSITPNIPNGQASEQFDSLMARQAELYIDTIQYMSGIDIFYTEEVEDLDFTFYENSINLECKGSVDHPGGFRSHLYNSSTGYAVITIDPVLHGVSGFVHTLTGYFEIVPVDSNGSLIFSKDLESVPALTEDTGSFGASSQTDLCDPSAYECKKVVDIVIMIPEDLEQELIARAGGLYGYGILSQVYSSIASVHSAFRNSDVEDYTLRASIVDIGNFDYSDMGTMGQRIMNDLDKIENDYDFLRDSYHADAIILFTTRNYGGIQGVVNAIGPDMAKPSAIVRYDMALAPRWTFAHEFGHLHGARHNTTANSGFLPSQGADNTETCVHAWRFNNSNLMDRTCLALAGGGNLRILHYSNPDVAFNGFATGTDDDNNSQAMRIGGCELETKKPPAYMKVTISGLNQVCRTVGEARLAAHVTEAASAFFGHPPYTYDWSVVSGDVLYVTTYNNEALVYFNTSGGITMRVDVKSNDCPSCPPVVPTYLCNIYNCEVSDEFYFYVSDCLTIEPEINQRSEWKSHSIAESSFMIYPMPADDFLNIEGGHVTNIASISLYDAEGRVEKVASLSGYLTRIDVSGLSEGLYFYRIENGTDIQSGKIMIIK